LDYVFSVLSDRKNQLDFAFIIHLPTSLSVESLQAGAASSRNKYPATQSFLYRRQWERLSGIDSLEITTDETKLQAFMDTPFDLRVDAPCRQILLIRPDVKVLATRFHHAVADGLSAAMWISHQLQVAQGKEQPINQPLHCNVPLLKHSSPSVRRSKFAYSQPSTPLRTCTSQTSNRRSWSSFTFEASQLKQLCRRLRGFTYNDLLAACALEVLMKWNAQVKNGSQVGLWLPMNIRRYSSSGFGNGTSRIRIYPRYERDSSFIEKAREIRKQVTWCTEHGEWVVPEVEALRRLPTWLTARLLNAYLSTRLVDMGTAVFSHGESLAGGVGDGLQIATQIECVGLLQKRQRLAINGTTHRGQTCLTFTYDSQLLCSDAISLLTEMYQQEIRVAREELSNARPR
jgi:hypothetical protein